MAVTATLVFAARNRLRYLLAQDGAAGTTATITSTGAATPDLRTDSVAGAIKNLARARVDGFMGLGPAALTQAQARRLWLGDESGVLETYSGEAFARCILTPRDSAVVNTWLIDANVDGGGDPTLNITAQAGAGSCYLDVEVSNQIGA